MVKESIFLKPRLTRASSFPKRTNWEARENRVSNRFLLSLHHASVILLPNSALAYSSTRRRGVVKKGNGRRVYEKRRPPVIEVFSLESSTYARYSTRTSRCVASSHETRRKRPTLFPLFHFAGTYTLLSRKVFSLVSYLRRRSSLEDGAVPIFFFPTTLLYRHPFGFRSVSTTVEVLLHLFNPEKENIESIFFKQGIKHERERE